MRVESNFSSHLNVLRYAKENLPKVIYSDTFPPMSMLDYSILLYTIGLPLLVLLITCATRYPMKSEIPVEEDRKTELVKFGVDTGLDCYFVGVVAVVSATIGRFGAAVPSLAVFVIIVYVSFSAIVGRLYKVDWKKMRNHCFTAGVLLLVFSIFYALAMFFLV